MSRIAALMVALASAAAIGVGTASAYGAQIEIEDYLERDWYYVETLFFRHRAPPADEDFSRQAPPRHQAGLAALEPPPQAYSELIAALPEEPLDFPRLEQFDCIAPPWAPWMETVEAAPSPPDAEAVPDEAQAVPGEEEGSESAQPTVKVAPVPTGPPAPSPEEQMRWAFEEFERGLMTEGWRWRYDGLSLRNAAARMRRSGDYAVLHHGGWLQAIPPRDSAQPLLIQLGASMPDATFELEGSVSVTLGRFLHFAAEVWLRQDSSDTRDSVELEGEADSISGVQSASAGPERSRTDAAGYALLSESRRMRPGEVHYLDHPWLGILVRIEPVEAPDALLKLAESLADR